MAAKALVLGIGNLLWADEGFGVRCVERMAEKYALPESVALVECGPHSLAALPYLEEAEALVVFDAVDRGKPPGTLWTVRGEDVPTLCDARRVALHQIDFQDAIATARMERRCPTDLTLIACQPAELEDFGGGLWPETAAQIEPAVDLARDRLAALGIPIAPGRTRAHRLTPARAREPVAE